MNRLIRKKHERIQDAVRRTEEAYGAIMADEQPHDDNKLSESTGPVTETRICVGLNEPAQKEEIFGNDKYVNILRDICSRHKISFSFDVKEGGYMHENGEFERKTALEITLSGADTALADNVAEDLCRAFHQDSVLITEGLARKYCIRENA